MHPLDRFRPAREDRTKRKLTAVNSLEWPESPSPVYPFPPRCKPNLSSASGRCASSNAEPCSLTESSICFVVITGCLLHRAMLGLLHRLRQGNTALRRLRQIPGSQPMRGKLPRLQARERTAPLYDQIDRLRRQRPLLHRLPAVDGAEDRTLADVGALQPFPQRLDRRPD